MEQLKETFKNATLAPSSMDLLLAVPRLAQRAGSFALFYIPEQFDSLLGKVRSPGSVIPEATTSSSINSTVITSAGLFAQSSTASWDVAMSTARRVAEESSNLFSLENIRNFGGIFSYITSRWALTTFIIAIVLNRTHFYASSRIPITLKWHLRTLIYFIPVLIFVYQTKWILQAMRCQASPEWSTRQYGSQGRSLDIDYAGEGGLVYRLSSTFLFWEDEQESCRNIRMLPAKQDAPRNHGSLSLLWPFFVSLGFAQFVETLACALQGRQPKPETGMTIFEHSLAFAEAEAVITRPLAMNRTVKPVTVQDGTILKLNSPWLIDMANAPPEVLIIALISSLSHLCSYILAISGLRSELRLISTSIWGISYMTAFVWSFVHAILNASDLDQGILRFPTVCVIGFIPHLIIFIGILVCGLIYSLAFLITAFSIEPEPGSSPSVRRRFAAAYKNLQANVHLATNSAIRISRSEDFYTTLLKVGFTVLTAASEAIYLNEGTRVNVAPHTWLEEKRIAEFLDERKFLERTLNTIPSEIKGDGVAESAAFNDRPSEGIVGRNVNGYARERRSRGIATAPDPTRAMEQGIGMMQRRSRWYMTIQFLKGIFWLQAGIAAKSVMALLRTLRINYVPGWLASFSRRGTPGSQKYRSRPTLRDVQRSRHEAREFWLLDERGELTLPKDLSIDVEAETRRRMESQLDRIGAENLDDVLSTSLYSWWKNKGWWGELDTSGEYIAPILEEDTTSVVSTSIGSEREDDWLSDDGDGTGRTTPTQRNPFPELQTRESTPSMNDLLDTARLATLLNPQTVEQQDEARMLARHLASDRILTRSQHRQLLRREQTRLLTTSRNFRAELAGQGGDAKSVSQEAEERLLEQFIVERREASGAASFRSRQGGATDGKWDSGAEGMGSDGPQCVVCQMSPRTILMWPCGCLSLCDDCRVGLATRNYTQCVCCRVNVVAYSRLYVP